MLFQEQERQLRQLRRQLEMKRKLLQKYKEINFKLNGLVTNGSATAAKSE